MDDSNGARSITVTRVARAFTSVALGFGVFSAVTFADSITVDGVTHENVLIREGASLYYVQDPQDGGVFTVPKENVAPKSVQISTDADERSRLHAEWRLQRGLGEKTDYQLQLERSQQQADAAVTPQGQPAAPQPPVVIRRPEGPVSDGRVKGVKLDDVTLAQALDAVLRPLGLDYRVQNGFVYVSTPERIRTEAYEPLETEVYEVNDMSGTLPKVIVSNQGGPAAGVGGGFGGGGAGGFGGGQGGFGGGQGGFGGGQAGFGGGAQGGFGGGGQGGFGGGQGGAQFSNISQLFSNIDDRIVGETPAVIGLGIVGTGRGFENR